MSDADPGPGENGTTVVRFFSGHASSVLWFPDPVEYDDSGLGAELVADLRAWQTAYETWSNPDLHGADEREARSLGDRSRVLALRVADEIGPAFLVEVSSGDAAGDVLRLRGAEGRSRSDASAAFERRAEHAREEWRLLREQRRQREESGSMPEIRVGFVRAPLSGAVARAPLSGAVFSFSSDSPEEQRKKRTEHDRRIAEAQRAVVSVAIEAAERALPIIERARAGDERPQLALAAARAVLSGDAGRGSADEASRAAHACGRDVLAAAGAEVPLEGWTLERITEEFGAGTAAAVASARAVGQAALAVSHPSNTGPAVGFAVAAVRLAASARGATAKEAESEALREQEVQRRGLPAELAGVYVVTEPR